ncbi:MULTISPECIES: DUF1622 domain-containing protein [Sphingomonas]|uniref:DUF1622 domain-containing protein n=1 Tax=Sphingomonas molluscorum TaxID=418184 RepID=A0ABU8Q0F1_9SPHN|nr:DUF1622 domain-containing protein [Sphingomonas sp. JUb134]MBM7404723.1 hypothetical protein [Sphingomonas sp. JUb134]
MEAWFHAFAAGVSLLLDALVIVSVCAGAGVAIYGTLRYVTTGVHPTGNRRGIWMGFARWLMLALEFALAADLVDTAIASACAGASPIRAGRTPGATSTRSPHLRRRNSTAPSR